MTDKDIDKKILDTVKAGDLKLLKTLAQQFPADFESFRHNKNSGTNLVETAWNNRRDDVAVYLIVQHGFEVSPQFDNHRSVLYSFAEGPNEYHRTMEVFANAALGSSPQHERDEAVNELVERLAQIDVKGTDTLRGMNSEFLRQVASGNCKEFVQHKMNDPRRARIPKAHSVKLVEALDKHMEAIELFNGATSSMPLPPAKGTREI